MILSNLLAFQKKLLRWAGNMARPKTVLDEDTVYDLASIHCTDEEIASMCKCSVDTLVNRFSEVLKEGRSVGKKSIRRKQAELVEQGNATMGIWLGKVYLGQKDTTHVLTEAIPTPRIPEAAVSMKKD